MNHTQTDIKHKYPLRFFHSFSFLSFILNVLGVFLYSVFNSPLQRNVPQLVKSEVPHFGKETKKKNRHELNNKES